MNKTIKSVKLYKRQSEIYREIISNEKLFHVVRASRQCGKTTMVTQLVCNFAINNLNATILYITPTFYLAESNIFPKIVKGLQHTGVIETVSKQDLIITFRTGSKILFRTAQSPESILGISADYIIVDEAAIIPDILFERYIIPTAASRGKKIIFISTPRGKNTFYKYYYNPECQSYDMHYSDNPNYNYDLLEITKKSTPERIFNCEYENQFLEDSGFVFRNIEKCATIEHYEGYIPGKTYYGGLDLGRKTDFSVLTIVDNNKNVVYIHRENKLNWSEMIQNIVKILRQYKCACLIEVNGVGDPVYEQIHKLYPNTIPFNTNNTNKQEIIEDLILLFDEQTIKIPTKDLNPELNNELINFDVQYSTRSKSIFYSAPQGQHDDMVMSLAFSNHCLKNKNKNRVSFFTV